MARLRFDDVRDALFLKGYTAEKALKGGGYRCEGERFKNLEELKTWGESLPPADESLPPSRFDNWDRQALWSYMASLRFDINKLFETEDGWKFERSTAIKALVEYEAAIAEIPPVIPTSGYIMNGEAYIDVYENGFMVGCEKLLEYDFYPAPAEEPEEGEAIACEPDFCWQDVQALLKSTVENVKKRMVKAVIATWQAIPKEWRGMAQALLKDRYLEKLQASCRTFAEMIRVTRLIDQLA